jgi:hypothetical protein
MESLSRNVMGQEERRANETFKFYYPYHRFDNAVVGWLQRPADENGRRYDGP